VSIPTWIGFIAERLADAAPAAAALARYAQLVKSAATVNVN
jgi:hypothetical protein